MFTYLVQWQCSSSVMIYGSHPSISSYYFPCWHRKMLKKKNRWHIDIRKCSPFMGKQLFGQLCFSGQLALLHFVPKNIQPSLPLTHHFFCKICCTKLHSVLFFMIFFLQIDSEFIVRIHKALIIVFSQCPEFYLVQRRDKISVYFT